MKTEDKDIGILFSFLDQFGAEVTGHEIDEPKSESTLLDRFAQGRCNARERQEICDMLRLHPAWLRWLADRVKMARAQQPGMREVQPS